MHVKIVYFLIFTIFQIQSDLAYSQSLFVELDDIKLQKRTCDAGYTPISLTTAMMYQDQLSSNMGEWQLTNIENGLIIMGPGYQGNIKPGNQLAYTGWCIDINKKNLYQGDLSLPFTLKAPNQQKLEWLLVNSKEFYIPLAELANMLGYAWSGGVDGIQSGEDMVSSVNARGVYHIKSDTIGADMLCSGYRCDERLIIDITNFKYSLLPHTITQESSVDESKEVLGKRTTIITNESNIEQQYRMTFTYKKQNSWRFKSSMNFEQAISVKSSFDLPFIGDSEVEASFSAGQSWGEEKSGVSSELVSDTIVVNIPAKHRQEVSMSMYKTRKTYPYNSQARVSYSFGLYGFLSWSGNADKLHPIDRPHKYYQWEVGRDAVEENKLDEQFENRNLPFQAHSWDWSWVVNQFGLPYVESVIDAIQRPIVIDVGGSLTVQSIYGADVHYGETIEIKEKKQVKRSLSPTPEWQIINFDDAFSDIQIDVQRL